MSVTRVVQVADNMNSQATASSSLRYVQNPHIEPMEEDILYHIHMSTKSVDFKKIFGHVKFVCVGGSPNRMLSVAKYISQELKEYVPDEDLKFENLTGTSDRYVLYKVGPVISASHGIGVPSMTILLHEMFKLLSHAGAEDVTLIRLGTSGGLGLDPGSVVVTSEAVNGMLLPVYEQMILGKRVENPAIINQQVADAIVSCQPADLQFSVVKGKTMCADDFYQAQGRVDGAICYHTEEEKSNFLKQLHDAGVRNIEMECVALASMAHQVNMKAAIVCVTLLDRMKGDQVTASYETLKDYETRPAMVVAQYMIDQLSKQ